MATRGEQVAAPLPAASLPATLSELARGRARAAAGTLPLASLLSPRSSRRSQRPARRLLSSGQVTLMGPGYAGPRRLRVLLGLVLRVLRLELLHHVLQDQLDFRGPTCC